ncbi:HPr kinase/phosphatase C-terminal domain-containing protein [Komagataeibacter oboediens]|uniref:HPr kinase/phosphorylase n=1 Tax=Komagataeibacter oboediens TaxID=65958 RepID=UPI001C2C5EB4|nr:HPr kinase/phosphatase C-terminal domain-containing protein [Komagataeibacter oboediens]MBV0887790.1 HPr kinase/phosphatase C-terminal domain-containing protein [Komagataeibacter oboediens]MCK9820008.1 HPr kinase/phosphatase C-terminal domain-containing protein [Komagataeibacter oboediens]
MNDPVQIHASCAARGEQGIMLCGPSGAGKSDLLLRLIDAGYDLVADDRVCMQAGWASAPPALAGLLEVRGIGIVRMPYRARVRVVAVARLVSPTDYPPRLPPAPKRDKVVGQPVFFLDPAQPSAVARIGLVLDCVAGDRQLLDERQM